MEIRWSLPAADDLERICEWIERDNPGGSAPRRQDHLRGCAQLKDFPNLGRASRMSGRRELAFPPPSYIAVYQVNQDVVEISRIFHGAQDWP